MDSNEAVPSLLIVVIVILYYLYRIKKKKLHEEEQKYIETFLIRDKDISGMRVGSPFKKGPGSPTKINKVRHQDSQLKGPESPLNSKGNLRSTGKLSPVRKTSGTLQGKVSPKVGNKLQFSEETRNYLSPQGKMEYVSPQRGPKDTMYNFESIRLQKIQEDSANSNTKNQQPESITNLSGTPIKSVPKGNLNAPFRAMHDTSPPSPGFENITTMKVAEKSITDEENLKVKEVLLKKDQGGRREICFKDSDSESDHEQVKIIHDSSFEEEPQNQEETRAESQKKQLPGKFKINLEYLEDLGSGMGLKKYIAKKTVQEYIPNTEHGSKTISQLLNSQKNIVPKAQTSSITSQSTQAAKPQGSTMFSSNTSTTTATSNQGQAGAANKPQGGLFAGSTGSAGSTSSTTQATTANTTMNKPQGGGLFGNSTAQGTATQGAATQGTAQTATSGGLFGNKSATTATTTTNNTTANKPQGGGGLFGNSAAQGTQAAKPQGTAGTAPLQVQTTGLLAQKNQSPDNATPLFPKGNQPQQASVPAGKMRERSAADDLGDTTAQKKMNIGK